MSAIPSDTGEAAEHSDISAIVSELPDDRLVCASEALDNGSIGHRPMVCTDLLRHHTGARIAHKRRTHPRSSGAIRLSADASCSI